MALQPSASEPQLSNLGVAGRLSVVIDELVALNASAGSPVVLVSKGYFQQVGLVAAQGLPSLPVDATLAILTVSGQPVRFRDDGTNPTATVGMPIAVGQSYTFKGTNALLAATKLIQTTATATVDVSYYG